MRAGKKFTLLISNEDMNNIFKIVKSLEQLGVLIYEVTETVKHEIRKQEGGFFSIFSTFSQLNSTTSNFLVSKIYKWKRIGKARRGYLNKNFYFPSIFETISRLLIISITSLDLMAFFQGTTYLEDKIRGMINLEKSEGTH